MYRTKWSYRLCRIGITPLGGWTYDGCDGGAGYRDCGGGMIPAGWVVTMVRVVRAPYRGTVCNGYSPSDFRIFRLFRRSNRYSLYPSAGGGVVMLNVGIKVSECSECSVGIIGPTCTGVPPLQRGVMGGPADTPSVEGYVAEKQHAQCGQEVRLCGSLRRGGLSRLAL